MRGRHFFCNEEQQWLSARDKALMALVSERLLMRAASHMSFNAKAPNRSASGNNSHAAVDKVFGGTPV